MNKSVKTVNLYKKELYSILKSADGEKNSDFCRVWLCDNARLLLNALNGYIQYCKKNHKPGFERLFDFCLNAVNNRLSPDIKSISEAFLSFAPDICECEALLTVLKTAYAVNALKNRDSEEKIGFSVKSIRALADIDTSELFENISETEKILNEDPAGIYGSMSEYSKSVYRKAVIKQAKNDGITEKEAAVEALNRAKSTENKNHIGFYLPVNKEHKTAVFYIFAEILLSVIICLILSICSKNPAVFFLILLPVFAFIKALSPLVASKLYPPRQMLSLDCEKDGIPLSSAVITVSSLLPDAKSANREYEHFAELKSSDFSKDTVILGLFDLKSSTTPYLSSDKADINAMKTVFARLNSDFGGGFVMAVRDRVFSPTENEFTGHERKRGAICDLVKLLYEAKNGFSVLYGDTQKLAEQKYILALDYDTELSFEALKKLLCIACHPLNKPVFDSKKRRIVSGCGCVVPRTETSVKSSCKTLFSTVFTSGGATAYSAGVSEKYMDLFGTSLFTGKGLIDIESYAKTCLYAFDDGKILSHDIPEGALLRTAFAGDIVFTDSFPSTPVSFFKRSERWIRGDIQNTPLIFRGTSASRISAVLPALSKYQLADNIRNAFNPVICLICLFAGSLTKNPASLILLISGILGISGEALISCFNSVFSGGISSLFRTFFSSSVSQSLRSALRALILLGTLPFNAAISTAAIIKAVYRISVSKKHTLQWTTAASSEKSGEKMWIFSLVFPLFCSVLFIFLSKFSAVLGVIILCAIPFSVSDGIKFKTEKVKISPQSKEILSSYMSSMWNYFAENVTGKENFLPPDNISEAPVKSTAHRTSPTNIGLYLVSCLAAADMAFITADELFERLNSTFDTIEKLLRCKGLLYNWYDTRSLLPLKPLFVSTVDCGNFEVCLVALKEGLKEYCGADKRFEELVKKAEKLLNEGDMTALFNKKRGLFSIGLDAVTNRLSDSFYDLFMSEAVMTSYYHIAKRDIPCSHWARLDRPLVKCGRYTAAVSWTGTMFEYFMPSLFLPLYENSFRYEALKVALNEQKKFAEKNMPYGVSESGYYAFDTALSYRYRANGIRKLALKRHADCEKIFSPYSTFLTLSLDGEKAIKNLSKFASLHALGRYGFYEAVDFSSPKNAVQDYMLVRSYMAHHIGMSIIACDNAVNGNIFVKRFMRDKNMISADSLLNEKIPFDAAISSKLFKSKENKKAPVGRNTTVNLRSNRSAAIFSNGEDSLICDNSGGNRFLHSSLSAISFCERTQGVFAGISLDGKTVIPLNDTNGELKDTCFFAEKEKSGIKISYGISLLNNFPAVAVPVKIKNTTQKAVTCSLLFYFEPDFEPVNSSHGHPAFDSLMIKASYDKKMKAVCFEQNSQSKQNFALAAGFYDNYDFLFECDREKALGREIYRRHPFQNNIPDFCNNTATVLPCAAIKAEISLKPGKSCEKVLLIAAGENKNDVLCTLTGIKRVELPDITKAAPRMLRDISIDGASPENFAEKVYFDRNTAERKKAVNDNILPVSALWQAGISGDLPLITVNTDKLPENAVEDFVKLHNALSLTGTANDLIFITSFSGDYKDVLPAGIQNVLKKYDCVLHTGEKGGIHILRLCDYPKEFITLLKAMPGIFFPEEAENEKQAEKPEKAFYLKSSPLGSTDNCFVPGGYHIGTKGVRPWCHTLSNQSFGTLVSDSSLGYTWALNSRQNKLTPWSNDINSDFCGEKILISSNGFVYDAVCGANVTFYDDKAVYTSVCGKIKARITVQTDNKAMKKRIRVKISGENTDETKISYYVKPFLAESEKSAEFVKKIPDEKCLIFKNPANTDYGGYCGFFAGTDFLIEEDESGFFISVNAKSESETDFFTVFSRSLKGIKRLKELPLREPICEKARFTAFSKEVNSFGSSLLLHNAFDTRVKARAGFYQCSGAYGYRDQLQDVCSLIPFYPETAKRQIIRSCAVQFAEGDVLHWYHEVPFDKPCFKGVKTHCSDDFLWLAFTVAEYVKKTKDVELLKIPVAFLSGEKLEKSEHERYDAFYPSKNKASVYEHCIRAIKHSFCFGEHSLPLIKSGDWNDSFSDVGLDFKGESVWLAEFLRLVCIKFIYICDLMKDEKNKLLMLKTADKMKEAVLKYGFNGKYFIRGYYDNGEKLGDETSDACKIDLLPQAFAVLSGVADDKKYSSALSCAIKMLYGKENGILKLFTPPFNKSTRRAGYVNDYPEGVRENGGQYTHAAIWFALALKKAGFKEEAIKLSEALCPANKYGENKKSPLFKNEPYAMTADICSENELKGQGGWSLYTGSAGWYLTLLRELEN